MSVNFYSVEQEVTDPDTYGRYSIETIGEFMGYKTSAQAVNAILKIVNGGAN